MGRRYATDTPSNSNREKIMRIETVIGALLQSVFRARVSLVVAIAALGMGSTISLGANLTTLATFNSVTGSAGVPLYVDSAGNLYGSTVFTVFKVAARTNALTALIGFNTNVNPTDLTMDGAGNLYGATYYGGDNGLGSVFEIPAGAKGYKTLASFNQTNGAHPVLGVTLDSAGNLYGTTYYGGATNNGTIFEIAAGTNTITSLASFNGLNGARPLGDLIADSAGHLYATTNGGGVSYNGTVFMFSPGSNAITPLGTFDELNAASPTAGLVSDSAGNLYGTAMTGGAHNAGIVFEIAAGTNRFTTLASFNFTNGQYPNGLIIDHAGNLFGTTKSGTPGGVGSVFEIAAGTNTITTLVSFNGSDGSTPYAGLVADSAGNLFGTTSQGGSNNYGTVFEITGSGFVTPEPSSLCLMTLGAIGLLRRRRARMR